MFESKYSKVLTIILIIIIVAIVILLGFLAFDYIHKYNTTKQASDFVENYEGEITTGGTNSNDDNKKDEEIENITSNGGEEIEINTSGNAGGSSSNTKKKYKGFTVVGTMKIPSINLEYPILEEPTTSALNTALIFLFPSSDNLNMPGNSVIAGHNYRNGTFFSNLKKLSNGAKIYVTDYRGTSLTYEVYNIFESNDTDTSFYQRDTNGLAELTLSTCTDASNDKRTIIFARQI